MGHVENRLSPEFHDATAPPLRPHGWRAYASVVAFRLLVPIIGAFARHGRLEVNYRGIAKARFGDGTGPNHRMVLRSLHTCLRVLRSPELGCGESWMDGEWSLPEGDLATLLGVFLKNEKAMMQSPAGRLILGAVRLATRAPVNDPERSRGNASHHYDLGNDLYSAFLDAGMNYSCAFFAKPGQSLRDAQLNKLRVTIDRLGVPEGGNVLDIGCGWGELSRLIARETAASRITGITLADKQLELARALAGPDIGRRLDYQLVDYRRYAVEHADTCDRIVSVGMFEHVGTRHLVDYFASIHRMLRNDGRALVHSIMRPARCETSPWIEKYIFPGGYIPTLDETMDAAQKAGLAPVREPFIHDSFHYAETLRLWRRNFLAAWPNLNRRRYDERFRRMWEFYLAGAQASFTEGGNFVAQILLKKV